MVFSKRFDDAPLSIHLVIVDRLIDVVLDPFREVVNGLALVVLGPVFLQNVNRLADQVFVDGVCRLAVDKTLSPYVQNIDLSVSLVFLGQVTS